MSANYLDLASGLVATSLGAVAGEWRHRQRLPDSTGHDRPGTQCYVALRFSFIVSINDLGPTGGQARISSTRIPVLRNTTDYAGTVVI